MSAKALTSLATNQFGFDAGLRAAASSRSGLNLSWLSVHSSSAMSSLWPDCLAIHQQNAPGRFAGGDWFRNSHKEPKPVDAVYLAILLFREAVTGHLVVHAGKTQRHRSDQSLPIRRSG
jgi:hypothetical protein